MRTMRPEDDPAEWRRVVEAAVHVQGVPAEEAQALRARFSTVYVEHGGRRCLDDRTPFIELRQQADGLLAFTFEDETRLVDLESVGDRAEAIESLAAEAAREFTLWW